MSFPVKTALMLVLCSAMRDGGADLRKDHKLEEQ